MQFPQKMDRILGIHLTLTKQQQQQIKLTNILSFLSEVFMFQWSSLHGILLYL